MKKKVRTQQSTPFYSNEPAVSRKQMADTSMTQSNFIGNKTSRVVDKAPARMSGLAGFSNKSRPATKPSGIKATKIGAKAAMPKQSKISKSKI